MIALDSRSPNPVVKGKSMNKETKSEVSLRLFILFHLRLFQNCTQYINPTTVVEIFASISSDYRCILVGVP